MAQVLLIVNQQCFLESGWCQQPDRTGQPTVTIGKPPARGDLGALSDNFLISSSRNGERWRRTAAKRAWQARGEASLYPDRLWYRHVEIAGTPSWHTITAHSERRDYAFTGHLQVNSGPPVVLGPIGLLDRKIMKLPRRVQYSCARARIGLSDVDCEADELASYNKTTEVFRWASWSVTAT